MAIKIGTVSSIGRAENWSITPDDRQEKVETVGGVFVEDYGHVAAGDVISCSATFDNTAYNTVLGYWNNRTLVKVIAQDGTQYNNRRVVVKGISYYADRLEKYKKLELEFWGV